MRKLMRVLDALLVLGVLYLLLWPTDVVPVAWNAPKTAGLTNAFASNARLAGFATLAPDAPGPEAIASGPDGTLYSGALDGRILAIRGDEVRELARVPGRPLGLRVRPDGSLVVAVVPIGIMEIAANGAVRTLVSHEGNRPIRFADDVDLLPDGKLVFTEATTRFSLAAFELDALEHGTTGSVFAFDPRTKELTPLLRGLSFANGVAVHPSGRYALINETWNYRVMRLWLAGERKGKREVFIDNLPGFPDNVSYDAKRKLFWVALGAPRDAALDFLAPWPAVRKAIARLPHALRPSPKRHAMVLAVNERGRVAHFFDDPSPDSYSPTTGVFATGDALYLGSYAHAGVARIPLAKLGVP
jgi:sugar lactone lactonase YvrE